MDKHTQTIRRQIADELFECVWPFCEIGAERVKNVNRLICAQLNINSIRNKFDSLVDIVNNNIDILMISETKLDLSFPNDQFHIYGFSELYRKFNRNDTGGGILSYIREYIPSKLIVTEMTIEGFLLTSI